MTKNSKTLGQCILDCNDDNSCESDCVNTFKNEYSECPCQVSSSSQNTYFESFQDKCPLGCPCDNYDCDLPEKKAILALYTRDFKPSVLIQPNGGITEGWRRISSTKFLSMKKNQLLFFSSTISKKT